MHHFRAFFGGDGVFIACRRAALLVPVCAQQSKPEQATPPAAVEVKAPELPAKIGLLDTRIRVEANGDMSKHVHTRIHINNELGVRQFSHSEF